jgi:hypothetical protein
MEYLEIAFGGFADVFEGLFDGIAVADAAGQLKDRGHKDPVFILVHQDVECDLLIHM